MDSYPTENESMEFDESMLPFGSEPLPQYFWSLVLVPGKRYAQQLTEDLKITHVSLGENAAENSVSMLYCETEDNQPHPICRLREGKVDQMSLNLFFPSGGDLTLFTSKTSATIHLLGHYQEVEPEDSDEEDSEEEEEDEEIDMAALKSLKRKALEEPEAAPASKKVKDIKKKAAAAASAPDLSKAKKEVAKKEVAKKEVAKKEVAKKEVAKKEVAKKEAPAKKEVAKKETLKKSVSKKDVAKKEPETPKKEVAKKETLKKSASKKDVAKKEPETPKKEAKKDGDIGVSKKMAMGVTCTVTQAGRGNVTARDGKKVKVQYRGTLAKGGKQFDAGKIDFRLGVGEVIKGWDIGVNGMKIGEKRTLIIPPNAGYGKRGAPPDIPGNSTLKFEVTLMNVQ